MQTSAKLADRSSHTIKHEVDAASIEIRTLLGHTIGSIMHLQFYDRLVQRLTPAAQRELLDVVLPPLSGLYREILRTHSLAG